MEQTSLKCYMADTGLLFSLAFSETEIMDNEVYKSILFDKLHLNEGMFMENIVAQMLTTAGHKLYFYSNSSRENAEDRMEIDFLTAKSKLTSRHNITPIEVKSSQRYTLSSINKCINKFGNYLSTHIVLHSADLKQEKSIDYLPLYMTPLL